MRIVLAIWMCLTAGAVAAEPTEALKAPGAVALMRHALAPVPVGRYLNAP